MESLSEGCGGDCQRWLLDGKLSAFFDAMGDMGKESSTATRGYDGV